VVCRAAITGFYIIVFAVHAPIRKALVFLLNRITCPSPGLKTVGWVPMLLVGSANESHSKSGCCFETNTGIASKQIELFSLSLFVFS